MKSRGIRSRGSWACLSPHHCLLYLGPGRNPLFGVSGGGDRRREPARQGGQQISRSLMRFRVSKLRRAGAVSLIRTQTRPRTRTMWPPNNGSRRLDDADKGVPRWAWKERWNSRYTTPPLPCFLLVTFLSFSLSLAGQTCYVRKRERGRRGARETGARGGRGREMKRRAPR